LSQSILPVDTQVRDFILKFKLSHGGDSPTYREIVAGTAVSSTSHVSAILNKLDRAGMIHLDGRHMIVPDLEITCTGLPAEGELRYKP